MPRCECRAARSLPRQAAVGRDVFGLHRRFGAKLLLLLVVCAEASAETTFAEDIAELDAHPSLEELAYQYGTDKSKDDHKYVDFYMTLLDPIRFKVRNITEFGVASGQSLQMWTDYFAKARVWGFDHYTHGTVKRYLTRNPRVTIKTFDAYHFTHKIANSMHWVNESMDIIIDDARHELKSQVTLLTLMWPFVRPGGYYIIEDVGPPSGEIRKNINEPSAWNEQHIHDPEAARIVRDNTAYVVDSTFGHRNWTTYSNTLVWNMSFIANGRDRHNTHIIVLRKRTPRHPPQPWQQFYGTNNVSGAQGGAMSRGWIYAEQRKEEIAKRGASSP